MGVKKDTGVRIWLRKEVYEKYKALKPEGMGDNQFMVYLLNLYEQVGRHQLEEVWKLFSLKGLSSSDNSPPSSPKNDNGSFSAPEPDLDSWDV